MPLFVQHEGLAMAPAVIHANVSRRELDSVIEI